MEGNFPKIFKYCSNLEYSTDCLKELYMYFSQNYELLVEKDEDLDNFEDNIIENLKEFKCKTHHMIEQTCKKKAKLISEYSLKIQKSIKSTKVPLKKIQLAFENRAKFCLLYNFQLSEEKLLKKIFLEEKRAFQNKYSPKTIKRKKPIITKVSRYTKVHSNIKKLSYPYSWKGCSFPLFHAKTTENGKVIGYINFSGNYVFDLSVHPFYFHQGLAQQLINYSFKEYLSKRNIEAITLDVRETNKPAIRLYKLIGFRVIKRVFPHYYDFHGGIKMKGNVEEVIKNTEYKK